ncbi:F510_1955 family glycosylhydrolase [Metabacillus sp. YM-086]|uniref:F510_1955 family glycosylhydrolase n=1 Tax=Metabacillus sp. YM-086 TaxID=3341729 RepID=UPI003A8C060F
MKLKSLFTMLILFILSIPVDVFAHGTEEEHKQEVMTNTFLTYGIFISTVLLIVGVIVLLTVKSRLKTVNVKKQEGRIKRDKLNRWLKVSQWVSLVSLLVLIATASFKIVNDGGKDGQVEFMHIHGLGITDNEDEVYVPAHDGLKVFKDGMWSNAEGEKHDYMGFSMVDDGFYSSGHPGEGSNLKNPFGVIKTTDMGKSLEMLDLYGEIDFHGMAVGYKSHAIYVINPQANSRMDDTGLYYSTDDTRTWTKSEMEGLDGKISSLAVHPTDDAIVALGTNEGIFISKDYGQTFEGISDSPTTAVSFSLEGELFAGIVSSTFTISKFDIETNGQTKLSIPSLTGENAIGYIGVNPQNEQQILFTTFEKDIYITQNGGESWEKIAEKGIGSTMNIQTSQSQTESQHSHGEHTEHGSNSKDEDPLDVSWEFDNEPTVGSKQTLQINIKDSSGEPVDKFDIEHEKLMHLIIVSEDLSIFQHLHPQFNGNGMFKVSTNFPKGGRYKLIADVVPSGQETSTVTKWIDIDGKSKKEAVIVDESLTKVIDGRRISLSFGGQIQSNKDMTMTFTLQDDKTGESINDLKPYLGAIGHVVIVSEDGEQYVHSHPMNKETSGPVAEFMTVFSERGIYKVWGQFNHKGEIVTVPFVVEVP